MNRMLYVICLGLITLTLPASATEEPTGMPAGGLSDQRTPAEPATIDHNEAIGNLPSFAHDVQDFEDAKRGLMARLDPRIIYKNGEPSPANKVWDLTAYDFQQLDAGGNPPPAPQSVNPSLWRNAVLNSIDGVFEVVEGFIYQVRGYDLSNMSAIRAPEGWIIIDPLTANETAAAALANLRNVTGDPVHIKAVIFTHSHVDHFGGVAGLFNDGKIPDDVDIYAPEGFLEEAVSENVIVGNTMGRRASYMYGPMLRRDERGQVDGGLGKSTPSGTTGIAIPDVSIKGDANDPTQIAGTPVKFQNVPGSEAPAEMLIYFETWDALCAAEDVTHTFHNVLTLRGAKVRDSLIWSKYLHETRTLFPDVRVLFASHHWPTWNYDQDGDDYPENRVLEIIEQQRDLYRYIHDQSVRLTNRGHTIQEVGELVKLPETLGSRWFNRGYYGTVNHNAKAVYQRYIGWFDGNPASLHQLPPVPASEKYIEYMGGLASILNKANTDYAAGEYRWVAMVLNHVVFGTTQGTPTQEAQAQIDEAKALLANTYDQLGYQAESGPWRNFYLTGAMELRHGVLPLPAVKTFTEDTVEAMSLEMIFDFLAIHVKGLEVGDLGPQGYVFNIDFHDPANTGSTDTDPLNDDSSWLLRNGVLNYDVSITDPAPDATLRMTRAELNAVVMGTKDPATLEVVDGIGEAAADHLWSVMDSFDFWFEIVGPNPIGAATPTRKN